MSRFLKLSKYLINTQLIRYVKIEPTKYEIKFITIDHHDFDAPKLIVKKKSFKLPKIKNIQSNKLYIFNY